MVSQVTPGLLQPNVLVEIDHGPPMELYRDSRQAVIRQPQPEMVGSRRRCLASLEPTGYDACPETGSDQSGTALSKLASSDKPTYFLESGCAEHPQESLPERRIPSSGHPDLASLVQDELAEGLAFATRHPVNARIGDQRGLSACCCPTGKDACDRKTMWEGSQCQTSFDGLHPVMTAPSDGASTDTDFFLNKGQEIRIEERALSHGYPISLPVPSGLRNVLRVEHASETQSSEIIQDFGTKMVSQWRHILEKRDSSFGARTYSPPEYDFSATSITTAHSIESRAKCRQDTHGFEFPTFMSEATHSHTGVSDPIGFPKETFMWMIGYNLMTLQCEKQAVLHLRNGSSELFLNMVAAAVSCLDILLPMAERVARDKQCTEQVHCLLEDPG
ncbi:hypothetical protein J7T55_001444 [Diaporthe amygdali]|uniref:uncharacterized protein n=1 Tax=Phomopsis amygdali TaxID=1214568 RepID=UPI0022FE10D2|nr:uncharacterized protein J7T55_001444 [Diaporthe amygdali]KAJ0115036.1 hypothetical protein J7T55_001444 [Diaporthe amygdali]